MPTAAVLERRPTLTDTDRASAWDDWETPAGGESAPPRLAGARFRCLCTDDPHLAGQSCMPIEPTRSDSETCLVVFACGCRARVEWSFLRRR